MAEPASNEAASPSEDTGSHSPGSGDRVATQTPTPRHQHSTPGFQAVNMPSVVQDERVATAATNTRSTPSSSTADYTKPAQSATGTPDATYPQSHSAQTDAMDQSTNDTGTYGTRSRNRTGIMRPNYAEDQEMDFEMSSTATTTSKKRTANDSAMSTVPGAIDETKRVPTHAGFVAVNGNSGGSSIASTKDSTPGTTAPATKKRKAPTQSNSNASASAPSATRKPGAAAASQTVRETNVMTFTKHRNTLNKRGELIADDGTKLCVNGKLFHSPNDDGASRRCAGSYPA
nr:hypothetical protein CFP56_50313 [Quercus suber]